MSAIPHNLVTNSHSRLAFYFSHPHNKRTHFSISLASEPFATPRYFHILKTQLPNFHNLKSFRANQRHLRAFKADGTVQKQQNVGDFNFDAFLSFFEFLCLASSMVISIGVAVSLAIPGSPKPILGWLGNRVFAWQCVLLVGGLMVGSVIRKRQWRRICMNFSKSGGSAVNLVERIEKLEEDLRSMATIIRGLSRQLQKLGIRFRVTRRTLKEPISQTAALAQKNSEATRALAVQEDILEKELGEIQKVLLAMQEQQEKQLELILAIGKTGKLWESKQRIIRDQDSKETHDLAANAKQIDINHVQSMTGKMDAND